MTAPAPEPPKALRPLLAEGEAGLFLAESLALTLIGAGVLTREQVVSAVETTIAAKRQSAADGEHPALSAEAAGLLSVLANSFGSADVRSVK